MTSTAVSPKLEAKFGLAVKVGCRTSSVVPDKRPDLAVAWAHVVQTKEAAVPCDADGRGAACRYAEAKRQVGDWSVRASV